MTTSYYAPQNGRFISKDAWIGDYSRPLSLNKWNYVEANPINRADPTGRFPEWCRSMLFKWGYTKCVLDAFGLVPAGSLFAASKDVTGSPGCWKGRVHYYGNGYLEGVSKVGTAVWTGEEIVYDFATMERMKFRYVGAGFGDTIIGGSLYASTIIGLRSDRELVTKYAGPGKVGFFGASLEIFSGVGGGAGLTLSRSLLDENLTAIGLYIGIGSGPDLIPILESGMGYVWYSPEEGSGIRYTQEGGPTEYGRMGIDIMNGNGSPWLDYEKDLGPIHNIYQSLSRSARHYAIQDLVRWSLIHAQMELEARRALADKR